MFDMMKMMGKVKEMQEKLKIAQDELSTITIQEESGAGLVKAIVNGKREVLKLEIDGSLYKEDDKQLMTDLIVAAINKALITAEAKSKEHLQQATKDMMPNIPGFDLGSFS